MKISIITINLNNHKGLEKTILSVMSQNNHNFEFVIIDGDSNDGSKDIISKYANHIDFSSSERDSGIYNAMNKGIREASGEYCLFLNSGDVLCNSSVIQDIMNLNPEAEIINGDAYVETEGSKPKLVKAPQKISFYTFYYHTILHQASLIKTSLFYQIGFYNEDLKIVGDWEFFIRAFFIHQAKYQHINIVISVFDNSGISSLSESSQICLKERSEMMQKYFPYFLDDYELLLPRSTFKFLKNIKTSSLLKTFFVFTSRMINHFLKIRIKKV